MCRDVDTGLAGVVCGAVRGPVCAPLGGRVACVVAAGVDVIADGGPVVFSVVEDVDNIAVGGVICVCGGVGGVVEIYLWY